MYNFFGKRRSTKKTIPPQLPAPDVAGTAFGRYLRYGRRTAFGNNGTMMKGPPCKGSMFGRRYFGAQRIPLFGKKKTEKIIKNPEENISPVTNENAFGRVYFGRYRRKNPRKGRKSAKPSKALVRMCRKYHIKVTRKVGKRKVYKKISVLKKQLKRKMRLHRKKTKKTKKHNTRFSLFGL
jgi:hypothetical protein